MARDRREYDRQRYKANKERIAEQQRQYRKAHKEKIAEYKRRYRENHKEQIAEQKRQYREANKEKIAKQARQWYEANQERIQQYREVNKEHIAEQRRKYCDSPFGRANRMVNNFRHSDTKYGRGECTITEDWIMENIFTSKCHYCGETNWKKLGCDRIDNDLPHTPENVVCSCMSCNKKRGALSYDEFLKRLKNGETLLKKNISYCSKPVIACNPETLEIVYEFPSVAEAARNGYNLGNVSTACRGCFNCEGNHTYKGLDWYFVN